MKDKTMSESLLIGFYLLDYMPQQSGGIDAAFIRSIHSLTQYAPQHRYVILANHENIDDLCLHFGSSQVEFVKIVPRPPSLIKRLQIKLQRTLWNNISDDVAKQIEALNLDVLHFPRQEIHTHPNNVPLVLTLYDIQHEYFPEFFSSALLQYRQNQYKRAMEQADRIVIAADYTQLTIAEKFPQHQHKTRRIYPGFETNWQSLNNKTPQSQLASYNLPERFIFYPANPWWHKNFSRLLAALCRLRDQGLVIPLVCTGKLKGEAPAILNQLIIAADATDLVYDLGYIDNETLLALYQSAEMLVFPSLFEGFGYPILEAQSNNLPVVCSNTTTLPEVAGEGALFFDPLDIDSISYAIKRVWEDENLRKSLCEKGRANLHRFDWANYARDVIMLYEELI